MANPFIVRIFPALSKAASFAADSIALYTAAWSKQWTSMRWQIG